jgi:hypothetical protein
VPERIPYFVDAATEGTVKLGPNGKFVLVSNAAEVEIELENLFESQRKKGANVGRPRFLGISPVEIAISFTVLAAEEVAFWRDVAPLLRAKTPKGNSPPLDIQSPPVNRLGVRTVILKKSKIGGPNAREGRHVSITLQEWSAKPVDPNADKSKKKSTDPPGFEPINIFENQ